MDHLFITKKWLYSKTISFLSFFFFGFSLNLYAQSNYQTIHTNALVIDLHNDALYSKIKGTNIENEHKYGQFDLLRMRRGGVDVQFFAADFFTNKGALGKEARGPRRPRVGEPTAALKAGGHPSDWAGLAPKARERTTA